MYLAGSVIRKSSNTAIMDARVALVRAIEVVRIAGHHHLHLEDPAPVAAAILAFAG